MQIARWMDWRSGKFPEREADRIYLGHETCQVLLPPPELAVKHAEAAKKRGAQVTLVTPFLIDVHLEKTKRLAHALLGSTGPLEVVTADWGLIGRLAGNPDFTLVLSRLLAAQVLDERIERFFWEPERFPRTEEQSSFGNGCVKKVPFGRELLEHCRTCWLDREMSADFLRRSGVRGAEINFPPLGLKRNRKEEGEGIRRNDLRFHLHASNVLIAATRTCPVEADDFSRRECAPSEDCDKIRPWKSKSFDAEFFRRGNALYYRLPDSTLSNIPDFVDRIVFDDRMGRT